MTKEVWTDGCLVTIADWYKKGEYIFHVARYAPGSRMGAPTWERAILFGEADYNAIMTHIDSMARAIIYNWDSISPARKLHS